MPWEVESICAQGPGMRGNDWVSIFVLWLVEYLLEDSGLEFSSLYNGG